VYALHEENVAEAIKEGFEAELFDLDDNWDAFHHYNMEETLFICALEDDAENVYLTIGLRDGLKAARLIALASTQEHASTLHLAGANKVISKLQATSDLIIELLEKPVVNQILDEIFREETALKTVQISIEEGSALVDQPLYDVSLQVEDELIILAVVDTTLQTSFVFTSRGSKHRLAVGDILVIIGYYEQIENFKRMAK
ncbi:MAG: NAD-binding protein, partial [Helicobacteraceae bacterium]|nr:NAD-binding protein [Helicobacteraceae bacterium]